MASGAESLLRAFYGRSVARVKDIGVGVTLPILELPPVNPRRLAPADAFQSDTGRMFHELRFDGRGV